MITGAAKVAGVVGWPVKHSLSPLIHNAWIEALGMDAVYVPFAVPPDKFKEAMSALAASGVVGVNVTIPHKQSAFWQADHHSREAMNAEAANVLIFKQGSLLAHNTDGAGLIAALTEGGWDADEDRPALLLGAGGAARAAASALPYPRVAARRPEAAKVLSQSDLTAFHFGFDQLSEALDGVTAVINATSAGLNGVGELPAMDGAPPGAVFMDMVYSPLRTKFLRDAAARGHPTVDGLAMLIGQARPSFEAFFGVPPPPPEVVDVRALCLKALGETE